MMVASYPDPMGAVAIVRVRAGRSVCGARDCWRAPAEFGLTGLIEVDFHNEGISMHLGVPSAPGQYVSFDTRQLTIL